MENLAKLQAKLAKSDNVFLGEEVFKKEYGLKLSYWFDPRVIDKLRRIRDSGISDEWTNILDTKSQPVLIYPQKLNMRENMLVQFSVLGVGCMLALF